MLQRLLVDRRQRAGQSADGRSGIEAVAQGIEARKIERLAAPLQHLDRLEIVRLDAFDDLVVQRIGASGHPERPVIDVTPCTAGNLAQFGRVQRPVLIAVELAVLGKGDMVHIEVEPHPDGVGGDQVVDVARLIEGDLRIAGARAERSHHDRCTAALPAHQLRDRVDLIRGKRDDRRATRQPRDLLRTGEHKLRQARPADHRQPRQQRLQDSAHCPGAEQKRLLAAAQMQDPVGEDVAAFEIGSELHLVDGHEGGVRLARHRLDGADGKPRAGRRDLLLAGHQRHVADADPRRDAMIDLAREKPERQPDDAGLVRNHPLDRVVRLSRIGRAEHGGNVTAAQDHGLATSGLGMKHQATI